MVTENHYRWDFIGLSTDQKPGSDNPKVTDGSTFYCSDNSKLYVWYNDQWYEKTATGGGGTTYTAGDGIDITEDTISVDTETIQEKLTAGTGIDITDNTISATGGEVIHQLTADDYNWNTLTNSAEEPYNSVALWKLDSGFYSLSSNQIQARYYKNGGSMETFDIAFVCNAGRYGTPIFKFVSEQNNPAGMSSIGRAFTVYFVNATLGTEMNSFPIFATADSLTYDNGDVPLSARQGKVLKDLIDALDVRVSALEGN